MKPLVGFHLLLIAILAGNGGAQADEGLVQTTLLDELAGTWSLVSRSVGRDDGGAGVFDHRPLGIKIMHPDGRFAIITTRPVLEDFMAVGDIPSGQHSTSQMAEAAHGTYSLDEVGRTITFHVETSTFANWEGMEHEGAFTLEGDAWRYAGPLPGLGEGALEVVWKRLE